MKHFDIYYLFFTQYMHTFEFKYCTLIIISVNNVYSGNYYNKQKHCNQQNLLLRQVNHGMQSVVAVLY